MTFKAACIRRPQKPSTLEPSPVAIEPPISMAPTESVSDAISEIDTVLNLNTENWQLTTDTKYLIDANNHTGYQQVLEETVTDANGDLIKKIVYTIGLDHISQTTFTPGGPAQGTHRRLPHGRPRFNANPD